MNQFSVFGGSKVLGKAVTESADDRNLKCRFMQVQTNRDCKSTQLTVVYIS